jgi:hypothetical protein
MIAEDESSYLSFTTSIAPGQYNQVGLAMYELPNMLFAWVLFLLRPRRDRGVVDVDEFDALRAENERLRTELAKVAGTSS